MYLDKKGPLKVSMVAIKYTLFVKLLSYQGILSKAQPKKIAKIVGKTSFIIVEVKLMYKDRNYTKYDSSK